MNDILVTLAPHVVELVSAGVMIVIGWAATYAKAKWRIEIEQSHRDALHMAIMTGIRAALARGDKDPVLSAVEHARVSVPDAIKAFPTVEQSIFNIAKAKLAEAMR